MVDGLCGKEVVIVLVWEAELADETVLEDDERLETLCVSVELGPGLVVAGAEALAGRGGGGVLGGERGGGGGVGRGEEGVEDAAHGPDQVEIDNGAPGNALGMESVGGVEELELLESGALPALALAEEEDLDLLATAAELSALVADLLVDVVADLLSLLFLAEAAVAVSGALVDWGEESEGEGVGEGAGAATRIEDVLLERARLRLRVIGD